MRDGAAVRAWPRMALIPLAVAVVILAGTPSSADSGSILLTKNTKFVASEGHVSTVSPTTWTFTWSPTTSFNRLIINIYVGDVAGDNSCRDTGGTAVFHNPGVDAGTNQPLVVTVPRSGTFCVEAAMVGGSKGTKVTLSFDHAT